MTLLLFIVTFAPFESRLESFGGTSIGNTSLKMTFYASSGMTRIRRRLLRLQLVNVPIAMFFALIAGAATGYFFYDKKRDTVLVRDLMHDRYFSSESVVDLARKEAWLAHITAYLRQVIRVRSPGFS